MKRMVKKVLLGGCLALCFCACAKEPVTPENPVEEVQTTEAPTATPEPTKAEANEPTETPKPSKESYMALFEGLEPAKAYKGLEDTNPLITQCYGADPYAMVYGDKVYFYMTADAYERDMTGAIKENSYGKIKTIRVISTSDMVNFEDHGAINVGGSKGAATWAANSWAPAAAWKNIDGQDKFFLYFADSARGSGVLVADNPTGPF